MICLSIGSLMFLRGRIKEVHNIIYQINWPAKDTLHGLSAFSSGSIWKTGKVLFNYIREQKLEDGRYRNCKKYFYSRPTHHQVNFLHIFEIIVRNI
jgi:hypothetical protein